MTTKQNIILSLIILALFCLGLLIIFSDYGFVDYSRLKKERAGLIEKNISLTRENLSMSREIDRLKNDPKYVENVVRKELGVIGKDEVIIKLKKNQDGNNDK
ncbi:MAG: cell division protein FtsB [Desulfobacteraceae bacterium Eth-SRB1]|nr:MAG: cell division protein FtsB [Desulfobacteraceae bacterium Eth-SRB1]